MGFLDFFSKRKKQEQAMIDTVKTALNLLDEKDKYILQLQNTISLQNRIISKDEDTATQLLFLKDDNDKMRFEADTMKKKISELRLGNQKLMDTKKELLSDIKELQYQNRILNSKVAQSVDLLSKAYKVLDLADLQKRTRKILENSPAFIKEPADSVITIRKGNIDIALLKDTNDGVNKEDDLEDFIPPPSISFDLYNEKGNGVKFNG